MSTADAFVEAVTDGSLLVAVPVAAAAGLVSFLSPCVLPLVPGYLSFVTGLSGAELGDERPVARAEGDLLVQAEPGTVRRGRVLLGSVLFVLGFSAVFVTSGALLGALGAALYDHRDVVERVLGVVTIGLGLVFLGVLPGAQRSVRLSRLPNPGLAGAPLLGVVFGLGWTPCLGPTLAAVQGLAFTQAGAERGALLTVRVLPRARRAVRPDGAGVPPRARRLRRRQAALRARHPHRRRAARARRAAARQRPVGDHHHRAARVHRRLRDRGMTLTDDAQRLSTQPLPPTAPKPSLLAPVRRTWRQLTSMRTALLLLFLLALASIPGGFLPQRRLNPVAVQSYTAEHPTLAPVLDRLGLFDVFASPWFAAVYLLLFVSLVGCLGPRIRLHARALRTPPPAVPRVLGRLPSHDRWETAAAPEQVLDAAAAQLRGWRTVRTATGVSAERGYLRETGNLLFHVALVGLLVGIALGGLFGFQGTVLVREGEGFSNTVLAFDDIKPGRRFDETRLVPFTVFLDDFRATYAEDGKALTFDADLTYLADPDAEPEPYALRVNSPLEVDGAKTYLLGHGYAPEVVVTDREGNELRQVVACLPQGVTFLSTCTIKVPDAAGEQLAFEGVFTPTTVQDPETGRVTSVYPALENPALTVVGYRGDLGIDSGAPTSVYALEDRSRLEPIGDGTPVRLAPGETWDLPGGGSLRFETTREWATFQVTQDPGKLVALGAASAMVLGLCLSLFVRRRRVWVRALPAGAGDPAGRTVVEVGGLARSGADAFREEFAGLTSRVRDAVPPAAPPSEGDPA